MGSADVGRTEHLPLRIEPEVGQVAEHSPESEGQVPADVLKHDPAGCQHVDPGGDSGPEVAGVIGTLPEAGVAERLARVPGAQQIG